MSIGGRYSNQSTAERRVNGRQGGLKSGHGWITAMSAEPPMPLPITPTGHPRKLPELKRHIWDGEKWTDE